MRRRHLALIPGALALVLLVACGSPNPVVTIRWTTKSEYNTAGFNLYRAESEDGPYVKINATLIPAKDDPALGGDYVYTDTQVVAGHTYYYKLEDLDTTGVREMHGPIKVVAGQASAPIR